MVMFRRQKSTSRANDARRVRQGHERNKSSGRDIQARIADLRSTPRGELADAAFLLSMAAKQQADQIRQSIKGRTKVEFEFDLPRNGDLADYLAEDAVSAIRHYEADVPTFMDILSQQAPDVDFTVHQREAVLMLAAMFREQRLEGILEGLRLAGLLNEPTKDRHAGFVP
jgi:hypothetical protein